MKIIKTIIGLFIVAALSTFIAANVNAQEANSTVDIVTAVATGEVAAPKPPSPWLGIIPILTPIIIAGIKWGVPKIPKKLLPILTPIVGAGLEIIMHYAGVETTGGLGGAILGASGSAVREAFDQMKKTTPTAPVANNPTPAA